MGTDFKKLGSCGGRSATANPGVFTAGPRIAATTGGDKPGQHKDLRGGMPASGGYKQAQTVVASKK